MPAKSLRTLRPLLALASFSSLIAEPEEGHVATSLTPDNGHLVVDVHGVPPAAPTFFSANVDQTVTLSPTEIAGTLRLDLRVAQGRPDTLTLGLAGDGEIVDATGAGLRDWSVRQSADAQGRRRFLDLHFASPVTSELHVLVHTRLRNPALPGTTAVLLAGPGEAVGFASTVTLLPENDLDLRVASSAGLTPLGDTLETRRALRFAAAGNAQLEVRLTAGGGLRPEAELVGAQISGRIDEATQSAELQLRGEVRAQKAGARLRLLAGHAAPAGRTAGDGWHLELTPDAAGKFFYTLICDRAGVLPIELLFAAAVRDDGDWRELEFSVPGGAIVPLQLEGLGADVTFKPDAPVVPEKIAAPADSAASVSPRPRDEGVASPTRWQGFLPADGSATLAWKHARAAESGALFFTSTELADVRIGAGRLRQSSSIAFQILQGKLAGVRLRVDGPGEVLAVEGANVVGWKMLPAAVSRVLDVRFSRPIETEGTLTIRAQAELGNWPVRAEPMRFAPEGGVRHSGFVRVANQGAVRIEVADAAGMMQLAPAQFPGPAAEAGARQVLVYRFPAASYSYHVMATPIQPEVGVSEIATCELTETGRVLNAAVELDVREAPLRDWSLRVPADYAVVAAAGSDVADYVAESEAKDGYRTLRLLFARPISGRELLQLRLEKNQAAAAGDWVLPALRFPGAKSVRGHIGVVATPGYRILPARVDQLVEVPLTFFPQQTPGLQQAWRLREPDWSAAVRIEALGQSVQADVFHLYSLREGMVYGSVLVNYFVVGAPANEWRLEVPAALGNVEIIGQGAGRDWRRDGDQVIVPLHQPVLGAASLLITFEQPLGARGGVVAPGQVRPLGVQAERGYLEVVSPRQLKSELRRVEGALLRLEPTELPAEYRLFTNSPSLAVYQYTARPFAFELGVEWHAPGETVEQVIDFARLSSQVSRDGQVVTEAQLFVKTRGRKDLRLVLPAGEKLWEARVDGELVNARIDGDQTLLPLPPRLNPNEPVAVALRLGQPASGAGARVTLRAPRAAGAATVASEWTVRADTGRLLVVRAGNAEPVRRNLTETGFEWIAQHGALVTFALIIAVAGAALLLREASGPRGVAGLLTAAITAGGALWLVSLALATRHVNTREITFAATMVRAGDTMALELDNLPGWRAMVVGWGVAAAAVGAVLAIVGMRRVAGARAYFTTGVVTLAAGLLAQHGGAALFFAATGVGVFFGLFVPGFVRWRRERRAPENPPTAESGLGTATALSVLLVGGLLWGAAGGPGELRAAERKVPSAAALAATPSGRERAPLFPDGTRAAESIVQTWSIRGERLFGTIDVTVRGASGDSFLLLRAPAVLTEFKGEGLRVSPATREGQPAYYVALDRDGTVTAQARFEMSMPDHAHGLPLPTGPAAMQRVTIELDQGGWEFASIAAVEILPTAGLGDNRSGATLVLAPQAGSTILLRPKRREIAAEAAQFFTETSTLYVPGPGVVNGLSRVTVRPAQGRVAELELAVPAGFTVGEVGHGPVGTWRFDPEKRRLRVAVEPAQAEAFSFTVETQRGAGELPFALVLEPPRTLGAASDVGTLALAFGGDAQSEAVRASELSAVNLEDFDGALLPRSREGQPLATLQNVWRYGPAGGRVELQVAPVAPEVRVTGRQVLSLDDDRIVLAADLNIAIARVGLFQLSLALPEGLEIESLSGAALSHWTEAQEKGQQVVTLHLNGRTIGEQAFALTLVGPAPRAQDAWPMPRLVVREATRQTGELLLVPGKGLRLRAAGRENAIQLDPRSLGAMQPGAIAFRLLAADWTLRVGIEALEPWVTAQALEEVTLREGEALTRLALRYRVENATVKRAQIKLPGLGAEAAATVHATGADVSDFVRVAGSPDVWEIRFQRAIAGETGVQIEWQGPAGRDPGRQTLAVPELLGARQVAQFVAVRGGGRLELEATAAPRGWTRIDWSAVPATLQSRSDRSVPALSFRVAEPESALVVSVHRHEVAEALALHVSAADLLTLFAPTGASVTAVEMKIEVLEKSTLRVRLPAGAQLFNTFVNGESAALVRDGDADLFYVAPSASGERTAVVRLVYSVPAESRRPIGLLGPSLSVPLENVTWRVVIPPGYALDRYAGTLRLRDDGGARTFGLADYLSQVSAKRSADAQEAITLLQRAGSLLQQGQQEQAGEMLSQVSNGFSLDAASNEDARVQLRTLKTQQAVLGLNTRRQRLYLDNRGDTTRNAQLEQAANLNPFMQGRLNFDPQQLDQLLMGNSAEENTALRGMAARIVDQQLTAEPAPRAIDVALPERGRVLTFVRRLQVDGSAPLQLSLSLARTARANWALDLALLAATALAAALGLARKRALPLRAP